MLPNLKRWATCEPCAFAWLQLVVRDEDVSKSSAVSSLISTLRVIFSLAGWHPALTLTSNLQVHSNLNPACQYIRMNSNLCTQRRPKQNALASRKLVVFLLHSSLFNVLFREVYLHVHLVGPRDTSKSSVWTYPGTAAGGCARPPHHVNY